MKKFVMLGAIAATLAACDGDIAKSVARAVLKDEIEQNNQQQAQVAPQQVQQLQPVNGLQPVQAIDPNTQQPVQVDQYGQPIQPAQANQVITQQDVQALPPKPAQPRVSERVVRKRAYVLTQHGSNVIVRRAPNKGAGRVGYLYDGEDIWVVGETNNCQTINGLYGCWVKVVDSTGLSGYSFGAYLQY